MKKMVCFTLSTIFWSTSAFCSSHGREPFPQLECWMVIVKNPANTLRAVKFAKSQRLYTQAYMTHEQERHFLATVTIDIKNTKCLGLIEENKDTIKILHSDNLTYTLEYNFLNKTTYHAALTSLETFPQIVKKSQEYDCFLDIYHPYQTKETWAVNAGYIEREYAT